MADRGVFKLSEYPVALGLGATAKVQERFSPTPRWFERLVSRTKGDGLEGRLVSMFSFHSNWDNWERHPHGHELVVCVAGRLTIIQEINRQRKSYALSVGDAVINPPGVWHTADIENSATVLFITAGAGTEHRRR